jgi:hypothetical protein
MSNMDKPETSTDDLKKGNENKLVEHSDYPTVSGNRQSPGLFALFKDGRM